MLLLCSVRINLFLLPIFPPSSHSNTTIEWDGDGKIGNKNKLILTEILPSMHET